MRTRRKYVSVLTLLFVLASVFPRSSVNAFSGEDLLYGNPWYHPAFTFMAAQEVGFSTHASASVAWHSDYIDSYAYNYMWWFLLPDFKEDFESTASKILKGTAFDRYIASLGIKPELIKLHFDDLTSPEQVDYMWYRYFSGTLAGLLWAAENGDVAAAHNILGVSLHAMQDFYSHSNWVDDPQRRGTTWLQIDPEKRATEWDLYSGTYEQPDQRGKPHGKFAPVCSILLESNVNGVLDNLYCGDLSPFLSTSLCEQWRECKGAQTVSFGLEIPLYGEKVEVPPNWVYLNPPGIALDNRWMSRIGAQKRELVDENGNWVPGKDENLITDQDCTEWFQDLSDAWATYDAIRTGDPQKGPSYVAPCNDVTDPLFAVATKRAQESSRLWLQIIEDVITEAGIGDFWAKVKTDSSLGQKHDQFEEWDRLPFQFVSAGDYPPASDADPTSEEYYLRVTLTTSSEQGSGTDADIVLQANNRSDLLDYGAAPEVSVGSGQTSSLLDSVFNHNDFEAGDREVFTVGPYSDIPSSISLLNKSITATDLATAIVNDLKQVWEGIRGFFINKADFVGKTAYVLDRSDLRRPKHTVPVYIYGGTEGAYRITFTVSRIAETEDTETYQLTLWTLYCIKESTVDQGTDSDEPFVIAIFQPLPGEKQAVLKMPSGDVDTGETRLILHSFDPVVVPKGQAVLSLYLEIYESDNETESDRDILLRKALGETEKQTASLIELVGRAVAADWKLADTEMILFSRSSQTIRYYGPIVRQSVNAWIDNGTSRTFGLGSPAPVYEIDIADRLFVNAPPVANAGGPYSGDEGSPIAIADASASDANLDDLTIQWTADSPLCTFSDPQTLNPFVTCGDNGHFQVSLTVSDGTDQVSSEGTIVVNNVPPTILTPPIPDQTIYKYQRGPTENPLQPPVSPGGDNGVANIITCVPPHPDNYAWIKFYRLDGNYEWEAPISGIGSIMPNGYLKIDGLPVDLNRFGMAGEPYRVEMWVDGKLEVSAGNYQIGEEIFRLQPWQDNPTPWQCGQLAWSRLGAISFDDKGTLDTHTATVDWGDGSQLEYGKVAGREVRFPQHGYADNGRHTVTVEICDDDGGCVTDELYVTVEYTTPIEPRNMR